MNISKNFRVLMIGGLVIALALILGPVGTAFAGKNFVADPLAADDVDADPGDGYCDDGSGNCPLRAAIMEANAREKGNDVITLIAGTYTLNIGGDDDAAARNGPHRPAGPPEAWDF